MFELVPGAGGGAGYTETVLHAFAGGSVDGSGPTGRLLLDSHGHLYGTTRNGASGLGAGCVFELSPAAGGAYQETLLHAFAGTTAQDGANPWAGLVMDGAGDLYGTTDQGGTYGMGAVFELSPAGGGGYAEAILHSFAGGSGDGAHPLSTLWLDTAGSLYGTTLGGGSAGNGGTVFRLDPAGAGGSVETLLHAFTGSAGDGLAPQAGVIMDSQGNLYGTAAQGGGTANDGVIWRID